MLKYGVENDHVTEDKKMLKIQEELTKKEHSAKISQLEAKVKMVEGSRNTVEKELKENKQKVLNLQEQVNKLVLEKDDLTRSLKNARDSLELEVTKRQRSEVSLNNMNQQLKLSIGNAGSGGPTYDQLIAKVKELEQDILYLNCSQKTVVVYNKETGCFEFIGESIYLK